jgi:hypothetical protein
MLLLVLVPEVEIELIELDDVPLVLDVVLLTVMTWNPSIRNRAGMMPARQIVH